MAKDASRTVWFGAQTKQGRFPDVEVSLYVLNRHGDADVYCTPLPWVETVSRQPGPSLYAWKAIYTQDTDELFLSSKSKPYMAAKMNVTQDGEPMAIAAFGCTIQGVSWEPTEFEFGLDLSYNERKLVREEKDALFTMYDQCCHEDSCKLWKLNGTETEDDNTIMWDGDSVELDFCHRPGSLCTKEGRLRKLDMRNYHMECELPVDELVVLKELRKIDLDGNWLTGQVGEVVGKLGSLPNMIRISIADNYLSGNLDDLGDYCHIFKPGRLSYLDLSSNKIGGKLIHCLFSEEDNFGRTSSGLLELRLAENNIGGEIPNSVTKESPLELLDLDHNSFYGPIPESFGGLKYMRTLRFAHNQLEGSIPDSVGNIPSLLLVSGKGNLFTSLPESWSDVNWQPPDYMKLVDFSDNALSGSFPVGLGNSDDLLGLQLGGNFLSGPLEFKEGMFHSILVLNVSFNFLTGELPEALKSISVFSPAEGDSFLLQRPLFDFRFNLFSGELPSFLYLEGASDLVDPTVYLGGNDAITCASPKEARHTGIECAPSQADNSTAEAEVNPVAGETEESDQTWFLPDATPSLISDESPNDDQAAVQPASQDLQVARETRSVDQSSRLDKGPDDRPVATSSTSKSGVTGFNTAAGVSAAVALFLVLVAALFLYKRARSRSLCGNVASTPPDEIMGYALMDQSPSRNNQKEHLVAGAAPSSCEV